MVQLERLLRYMQCALLLIVAGNQNLLCGKGARTEQNYVLAAIPLLLDIRIQILNVRILPQLW